MSTALEGDELLEACKEWRRKHGNIDLTLTWRWQGVTKEQYDAALRDWSRIIGRDEDEPQ